MNRRNNRFLFIAIMTIAAIFLAGCPNTLVDKIDEEVKVVVTPPSVVSIYPETDSVNIPVDMENVLITFTKGIESSSVNNSTFITKDSDNNTVSGTYSVSNDTIAFNPSSSLRYSTVYTITAKSAILDIDGNPMADEFSWTFTTEEAPAGIQPVIQVFEIDSGKSATNSENVELGIYATDYSGGTAGLSFHYRISGDTDWSDWFDLTDGAGSVVKTLSIVSGVTEIFTFEAEVKDLQGILSPVISTQIIYEVTPPSVIGVSWYNDSTFPYNGTSLKITFDEPMAPGSFTESNFTLWKVSDGTLVEGTINLNSTDTAENIIAELWNLTLEPNTDYKVVLVPDVTDIAGTPMGGENKIWYFSTGDSTDTLPPEGDLSVTGAVELPSGAIAVGSAVISLDLTKITDDYNTVWGMKFWGDNSGSEENFEQNAVWETFSTSRAWQVSSGDGVKFVLCKFVDSAGNESENPIQIKILLDSTAPSDPVVTINDGDDYTNAEDGKIDLVIASSDLLSGVKEMMISNTSDFSGASWENWAPTVNGWSLSSGDGSKSVYIKTRDYLDKESGTGQNTIILDTVAPVVSFNSGELMVNSELQMLEGSTGSDIYNVTDVSTPPSDFTYLWEKISGSGNMYINGVPSDGNANDAADIEEPYISADTEGTYFIQITIIDGAGNSSSASVPFTWDETAPGEISGLTVPVYNSTGQPVWSWDSVLDADYYEVSFASDFSGSFTTSTNSFSPNTVLTPDGTKTLYVRAMDYAGNNSAASSASVHVDITDPTITVTTNSYIANKTTPEISIDFSGANGSVSDSAAGSSGLDSESYIWSKTSGSGTINFGSPNALVTTVSATANDSYQIRLTVTDIAGNITYADLSFLRDINEPGTPGVSGPVLTPSVRPTWFWVSGGGGAGVFKWNLDGGSWSADTTDTSYMPAADISGSTSGIDHVLYVQERDIAGNWSASGNWTIRIDTDAKTPPSISIEDSLPSLRKDNYATWNAVSGLGGAATRYQYRLDGGSWYIVGSGLSVDPANPTVIPQFTGLDHGDHTLEIEEEMDSTWQTGSSHTITVDLVAPTAPNITSTGLDTGNSDRKAINYTTPQWTWSGSGGGNGRYRYRLTRVNYADGTVRNDTIIGLTSEITATSYTSLSQSEGTYKFEVQERDDAGNWSDYSYIKTTIDTTAPLLSSVGIEGTTRSDDTSNIYTRTANVLVRIGGNISSEDNSAYTRPVAINVYDYNPSAWVDYSTPWSTADKMEETISITLPSTNGTRYVYIRLRDEAGNTTSYINDTIILDTVAPTGTFSINNGAVYTPSLYFKMNLGFTDTYSSAADLLVSDYDQYVTGWNSYRAYSTTMTSDFPFPSYAGTKYARVRVMDAAGNYVEKSENIVLQVPVPNYAYKGYYSTGATTVFYSPVTEDSGSATTYYYTYSSTDSTLDPNANPVDAAALTNHGGVTTTSNRYVSGIPKETLLYFWMRAYNGDTGGWGPYSATSVMGYSANITIIYTSADESIAEYMKNSILKEDIPSLSTAITGTMPVWSVMLLPDTLVSSTYSLENIIYGDPVILTPNTLLYTSTGKTRNIVAAGHGVVGMGYFGGLQFFNTVSDNWTSWGYPATTTTDSLQQPDEICYGNAYTISSDKYFMYTWRYSNSVWGSPLSSTYITTSDEGNVQIGYSPGLKERALTRTGRDNPVNGYLYGRSQDYSDKFSVVRQGRFLFYGYDGNWTRAITGRTYFVNLIARMDNY